MWLDFANPQPISLRREEKGKAVDGFDLFARLRTLQCLPNTAWLESSAISKKRRFSFFLSFVPLSISASTIFETEAA